RLDGGVDGLGDVLVVLNDARQRLVDQGPHQVLGAGPFGLLGCLDDIVQADFLVCDFRGSGGPGGLRLFARAHDFASPSGEPPAPRASDSLPMASLFCRIFSSKPSSSSERSTLVKRSRSLSRVSISFFNGSTWSTTRLGSKSAIELNSSLMAISVPSPLS